MAPGVLEHDCNADIGANHEVSDTASHAYPSLPASRQSQLKTLLHPILVIVILTPWPQSMGNLTWPRIQLGSRKDFRVYGVPYRISVDYHGWCGVIVTSYGVLVRLCGLFGIAMTAYGVVYGYSYLFVYWTSSDVRNIFTTRYHCTLE